MDFKNCLIRTTLSLLPKSNQASRPSNAPQRILIVSTTALGDTLWATPALESLRASFPKAYIGVLTSPIGTQVLKHNPCIDCLFMLKEPMLPQFMRLKKILSNEQFDTVLIFHASQRLILPLCSLLGAKKIIGTEKLNKGFDDLLTEPLIQTYEHEIVRRLRMVEKIGGTITSETLSFFLQPEEKLPPRSGTWIAIHPGSKDGFKRWPTKNFIAVGKALKKHLSCNILVTGTNSETNLMKEVAEGIEGAVLSDPNLSLRGFAALLKQMQLLICNDTGPFHLACALNTPALGIYSATDPNLCGPHKAFSSHAIAKKKSCTPCLKRKCKEPFCLLQIGSDAVVESALQLLGQSFS